MTNQKLKNRKKYIIKYDLYFYLREKQENPYNFLKE